ncbi:MAG: response regulator [Candidatus Zapsychrus exili]|nr:response regulator [Candidatus Zapsychrus exili]
MTGRKILIVDDEEDLLKLIRARLIANNYDVIVAQDGSECLIKVEECSPDLIVMDIMMPNMDGVEAARRLKENPSTENIPVLFLTSAITREDQASDCPINVHDVYYPAIAKPFSPEELLKKIRELLNED